MSAQLPLVWVLLAMALQRRRARRPAWTLGAHRRPPRKIPLRGRRCPSLMLLAVGLYLANAALLFCVLRGLGFGVSHDRKRLILRWC